MVKERGGIRRKEVTELLVGAQTKPNETKQANKQARQPAKKTERILFWHPDFLLCFPQNVQTYINGNLITNIKNDNFYFPGR